MDHLRFGTGGVPHSAKARSTAAGVRRIAELGLQSLEVEFVHGVKMSPETAAEINALARELDVALTAHGPYYVNLASEEGQKRGASRSYLIKTGVACYQMGARSFTFHAAFYQKQDKEAVYEAVKAQIQKIQTALADEGVSGVTIKPELTGKATQFGELAELIRLSRELDGVQPCIDFAHAHARSGGAFNTYDEFAGMLQQMRDGLGQSALGQMHIHVSGIVYSDKGERHHVPLEESDLRWRELLQALKDFRVKGIVVCESPNLEEDALLMQRYWREIGGDA
jgi:deoxyribonuclease-4